MQICNKRGEIYKLCALFFTESSNSIGLEGGGGGREKSEYLLLLTEVPYILRFRLKTHAFENGDFRKRFQKGRQLKTPYFENDLFLVRTG